MLNVAQDIRHSCLEMPSDSASAGRVRVCEPGQLLFSQGDDCAGLYVVVSGIVGLRRCSEDGEAALLQLRRAGDFLGQDAVLSSLPHGVSAEVLTLSRIRFIDRCEVRRLRARDSAFNQDLLAQVVGELERAHERCASLLTSDLKRRLIETLMIFRDETAAEAQPGVIAVDLPIQRKDLAALIGAAPESLSRLIGKLEAAGELSIDGRRMVLARRAVAHADAPECTQMLDALMRARTALLALLDTKDGSARRRLERQIARASGELDTILGEPRGPEAVALASFARIWEQFKHTRECEILPAIRSGRLGQARSKAYGIQAQRLAKMKRVLHAA